LLKTAAVTQKQNRVVVSAYLTPSLLAKIAQDDSSLSLPAATPNSTGLQK